VQREDKLVQTSLKPKDRRRRKEALAKLEARGREIAVQEQVLRGLERIRLQLKC
jgi:hypothetical protein